MPRGSPKKTLTKKISLLSLLPFSLPLCCSSLAFIAITWLVLIAEIIRTLLIEGISFGWKSMSSMVLTATLLHMRTVLADCLSNFLTLRGLLDHLFFCLILHAWKVKNKLLRVIHLLFVCTYQSKTLFHSFWSGKMTL